MVKPKSGVVALLNQRAQAEDRLTKISGWVEEAKKDPSTSKNVDDLLNIGEKAQETLNEIDKHLGIRKT